LGRRFAATASVGIGNPRLTPWATCGDRFAVYQVRVDYAAGVIALDSPDGKPIAVSSLRG